MNPILFYSVDEPFGEFSNHSPHPIHVHGKIWPTVEHYFQAQKFPGTDHEEAIRRAPTSQLAAELGRDRTQRLRGDWEQVKESLMREALHAKFTQHAALRERLLSTGDAPLVEHTAKDAYWGDGPDGQGRNRLGVLLMELRAELRA